MSTLVGMCLNGRYRLDAQIGSGGMSTVYRAFDMTLERQVAVKLMHREIASDSDQLERFRREARAVAQLSHPHIVGVIDAGEEDGRPYIVFEYVEGETLKDRIRRMGRLPVDEAIAYAIEIARALGAAHARGIVHRDIKPQNVLSTRRARPRSPTSGSRARSTRTGLTADGRVLGTTDYVSPEQALGHDVNGQSDIYSLGVVLFEMLTGDVPFHGENQVSVAMKHVREDMPDVKEERPEVSAGARRGARPDDGQGPPAPPPRRASVVADLEDALALEASRTGTSTGEATAVLRTLPAAKQRRLPLRLRLRMPVLFLILLVALSGAVLFFLLKEGVDRTHRGAGAGRIKAPPGERIVSVKRTSANDFDPLGDQSEHPDEARLAVDQDPGTAWTTETYTNNVLNKPRGEPGVGLYVDAEPRVNATAVDIQTPTPGWRMELYAARTRPPADGWPNPVWTRVGGGTVTRRHERFDLVTGGRAYRYYLVWITQLPPDEGRVEITQVTLFAPKQTS